MFLYYPFMNFEKKTIRFLCEMCENLRAYNSLYVGHEA